MDSTVNQIGRYVPLTAFVILVLFVKAGNQRGDDPLDVL
jgi:hypothetical protein